MGFVHSRHLIEALEDLKYEVNNIYEATSEDCQYWLKKLLQILLAKEKGDLDELNK